MAAGTTPAGSRAVTLEQFIAFNDEIASLIQVGLPLEFGLQETGRDLPGAIGRLSTRLGARMSQGESLPEAITAEGSLFPSTYRAIVEAGLKSGNLAAALEAISNFARTVVNLRKKIELALIYPLIVLTFAYGLFLVFLLACVQRLRDMHVTMRIPIHAGLQFLIHASESIASWCWILPLMIVLVICWWHMSRRASRLDVTRVSVPMGWIPGMRRLAINFSWANFADLLALLVEHRVPLPEGIVLAAEATGSRSLCSSATLIAAALERGTPAPETTGIPSYLRWLLIRHPPHASFVQALRQASEMYRRRVEIQIGWMTVLLPFIAAVIIGGGATLVYGLAIFAPFSDMLKELSRT